MVESLISCCEPRSGLQNVLDTVSFCRHFVWQVNRRVEAELQRRFQQQISSAAYQEKAQKRLDRERKEREEAMHAEVRAAMEWTNTLCTGNPETIAKDFKVEYTI